MVGTQEKGFVNVEITAASPGGHSSMPPPHTAVGAVAAAVRELEEHPMPTRITGATRSSFEFLAPEMPFVPRLVLANLWLLGPLAERRFADDPAGNARIRTTTAATMIAGGVKENVLPLQARAVVNFRILPGDTVAGVLDHVRRTVGPGVRVAREGSHAIDPSAEASPDSPEFRLLQRTVAEALPGTLVAPNLLSGGTDTRHYERLSPAIYRFLPVHLEARDLTRIHGTDERVAVADYAAAVGFYGRLLRNVS
jgi:carboxypeptidase PM20D1